MKLLKTMTYPGFPSPGIETVTREAARIILVDSNGIVPIVYAGNNWVYQIPGGGIDNGETILEALHREAMEESGCEIEVLGEIGKIIDQRPANVCKFGVNLVQTSYCYYGRIISKSQHNFTDDEIHQGYELLWMPAGEVLEKMKNTKARVPKAEIEAKRDRYIFEEYLKICP